jgi:two-component system, cell cycle response regulator DivK
MGSVAARRSSYRPKAPATGTRRKVLDTALAPLVLIVDDSEDTRDLYAEFLVHSGLRVAQAVDGDHGLWKVVSFMPAVVVMDLSMPVIDGWEATKHIKTHPKTKHIPVIALTGHVSAENVRRAEEAGADAVLTKPCAPDALLVVVRRLLAR